MLHTEIDSNIFENASIMVDMCRCEYDRLGLRIKASQLKGVEICNTASALLALRLVDSLPDAPQLQAVKEATIESLSAAVRQ